MWFVRKSQSLLLCCIAIMLMSCTDQDTIAAFQTRSQTIALRQAHDGGGYFISISPRTMLPLAGYTTARIESIWDTRSARLIVVSGVNAACPLSYTVIVATAQATSVRPIGECGEVYGFAQEGEIFTIRQSDSRERKSWIFRDGALHGPIIQRVHLRKARAKPAPAAEGSNDPTSPPPVSVPVGDEVIPAPVSRSGRPRSKSNHAPNS